MKELILPRVAGNEPDAVRDCIARYEGLIWALAMRFCRNHADAEDAVQNVFVELWRSAGRFEPSLGSETTFVGVIARREMIDWFRTTQRRRATVAIDEQDEPLARSHSQSVERQEEARRAASLVSRLRRNEQLAIALSIDRGLSHHRISLATGIPIGTVKTHVRRGLVKLRGMLAAREAKAELGCADRLEAGASGRQRHGRA